MLTREALTAAGWRLTSAHAASSYSVAVVVTPDGTALGDGDMVRIREDGTIDPDPLTGSGKLTCGAEVRELLTETEEPSYFSGDTLTPDTVTPCATMRETDQGGDGYPTWAAHNWLTGNEEPYRYWHARACECVRRFRHAPGTASARQEAALRCLTDALAADMESHSQTQRPGARPPTWALRRVEWHRQKRLGASARGSHGGRPIPGRLRGEREVMRDATNALRPSPAPRATPKRSG